MNIDDDLLIRSLAALGENPDQVSEAERRTASFRAILRQASPAPGGTSEPSPLEQGRHRVRVLERLASGRRDLVAAAGAVAAVVAVVLVTAGGLLGTALTHSTTGGPSASGSPSHSRGGPGFPQGPPPGPPPSSFPARPNRPAIVMLQPSGDQDTVYLVHGSGWPPFHQVRLTLAGLRGKAAVLTADRAGTFNYAVNQGHTFFPGPIPPGIYQVQVTASGGRHAHATFQVTPSHPTHPTLDSARRGSFSLRRPAVVMMPGSPEQQMAR